MIKAEGKTASEAFTEGQFVQLGLHLNNSNGKVFAIAYRDAGNAKYTKSKAKTEQTALKRAYDSTKENAWKPMAFAPYSTNRNGMSRWGALDFDGHDGGVDEDRARQWAFCCWRSLLNQAPCVICEHSGRGWHVWLVWKEFKAANWINHLLRSTALEAGCEIVAGKCEIFPEAAPSGYGKPMRMPGTFNPATGRCSIILSENVQASEVLNSLYVALTPFSRTNATDIEKNTLCSVSIYRDWADAWQDQYAIKAPSSRHDRLVKLVYEIFNQVGLGQAELMAGMQFDQKQVTTRADRAQHMSEFKVIWSGLENKVVDSLGGMQVIGEVVSAEYVRSEPGAARTFLKMHRLLLGLSGLPEKDIFAAAQRIFPAEHTAYLRAVDAGEIAPLIFGPHTDRFKISFDPELN
jgi:hypothetical protein